MTSRIWQSIRANHAKAAIVIAVLALVNIVAWLATWRTSSTYTFLLASAWLAYSFGLRHAVDADHISAIDNVTRKLVREQKRPVGVGFYFSLGHSTVVILLCAGLAASASYVQKHLHQWDFLGGVIGTIVSGAFLYIIGIINLIVLIDLYRTYRKATDGNDFNQEDLGKVLAQRGLLGRLFAPLLKLVTHSWQMYFVGFLFGLGFDTATEVGILAISARSAHSGIPFWTIMLLPLLFTVGMCLVDTLDGIFMTGAYGWAALNPKRQFRYNFTITLVSILVAFVVGTYEIVQMTADQLSLRGAVWRYLDNMDLSRLGIGIILMFAASWVVMVLLARRRTSPA